MRLLVTGYTGFVGQHLVNALVPLNYSLTFVGRKPAEITTQNSEFYPFSFDDKHMSCELKSKVDVVIHCAARAHIMKDEVPDPYKEYHRVNVDGTIALAKLAHENGAKRFIYLSSVKALGEKTLAEGCFHHASEYAPEDDYGVSKAEAEKALISYCNSVGMEFVIIRPPLVYGRNVKANFASLYTLVGKGVPLPFKGINQNRRSIVAVDNLVDLIICCVTHRRASNQIFMVSDGEDFSTSSLVKMMSISQGGKGKGIYVPVWLLSALGKLAGKQQMVSRLIDSLQVSISHTTEVLEWRPVVNTMSALSKMNKKDS